MVEGTAEKVSWHRCVTKVVLRLQGDGKLVRPYRGWYVHAGTAVHKQHSTVLARSFLVREAWKLLKRKREDENVRKWSFGKPVVSGGKKSPGGNAVWRVKAAAGPHPRGPAAPVPSPHGAGLGAATAPPLPGAGPARPLPLALAAGEPPCPPPPGSAAGDSGQPAGIKL